MNRVSNILIHRRLRVIEVIRQHGGGFYLIPRKLLIETLKAEAPIWVAFWPDARTTLSAALLIPTRL